jgi:excisionase family DNA binding protein
MSQQQGGTIVMEQPPQQDIYTVDDVARILQVHRMTVLRKIRQGKLKAFRTNGDSGPYRVKRDALDEYTAYREQMIEETDE